MINIRFAELKKRPYFCARNRSQKMKKSSRLLNYIPKPDGGASILLYGEVGPWGEITSERVVAELLALEREYHSIDVRINSNGGDVFTGIAIFNALAQSKADIKIYIDGIAASIAGVIALCGKPLYMSQYARLMLHKVSGGAYGSARELRETADLIDDLEGSLAEMIGARAKLSKEEVHSRYFADGKDHWLGAQAALEAGMIDGIHDLPEVEDLSSSSSVEDIYKVFNNRLQSEATDKTDMALLDDIKRVPGFTGATESNVVALLQEQATKLAQRDEEIAGLKAKVSESEAREAEALLNAAITDGRISEAQKPHYMALLKSDRATTEELLASLSKREPAPAPKPMRSARDYTQPSGSASGKYQGKTWDELDRANLLKEYKDNDPLGFADFYKETFGVDYKF